MVLVIVASTKVSLSVLTPRPPSQPRPDDKPDVEALEALIEEARRRARRRRRGYAALLIAAAAALLGYFGFNNGGGSARSQGARDGSQVAPQTPSQGKPAGLQPAAGIEGGLISAVAIDPRSPKTVFAATPRAGLFKSTDGGGSWHSLAIPLSAAPIISLAIAPADPETVYAGTGRGVFKTTDGGATWRAANDGLFGKESAYEREWRLTEGYVQALVVDPGDPETVYAGTRQRGLFKSTNGGASWVRVNPAAVRLVILDPNDPQTDYIGADGTSWNATSGVFKSTDGGGTWAAAGLQREEGDPLGNGPSLLAVDPQNSQTLYASRGTGLLKSTDGGSSWHPAGAPAGDVLVLAIDPLDSETLYAGADGGIFKSTDGGRSWTVLQAGMEAGVGFNEVLVLDPSNPATLYAGAGDAGVIKSTDSGRSWDVSTAGMAGARVDEIAAPSRGSAYALVGSQGLFKRAQHGWRPVFTPPPATALAILAVDPQSPETLYVVTDDGRIFGTRDGGDNWRSLPAPPIPKTAEIAALAVDAQNSRTLYAGTADYSDTGNAWNYTYKSSDGGATWRALQPDGLGPRELSLLAVDPRNPTTLHATGDLYYRSDDGGTTWKTPYVGQSLHNVGVGALAFDPSEPATMYLGTDDARVYKSTDGGANWRDLNVRFRDPLSEDRVTALAVNPHARKKVYAGTDSGLFVSRDGGESWRHYKGGGLLARGIYDLAIDPSGRTLYIGGRAGVFELGTRRPH
jgi:photosystem II stability/assembly factor-like uncharacterized protein